MTGAEALVKTLLANDINVCFANPGTSEMHFVQALDQHPEMRCILGLFEGGVTGAADGYYRMSDKVSATLLHCGPGLSNGWANLHNAVKSKTGVLNIVGDHATWHVDFPSPLNSDVRGLAQSISHWVSTPKTADDVANLAAQAIAAAKTLPGQVSTLILPSDTAWSDVSERPTPTINPRRPKSPKPNAIQMASRMLRKANAALFVGDCGLYDGTFELAGQIAAKTGCELFIPFRSRRIPRGAGRVMARRLTPSVPANQKILGHIRNFVNVGADWPYAFFAFPGVPSTPFHDACDAFLLADPTMNLHRTLHALATELDAHNAVPNLATLRRPPLPTGDLTPQTIGVALAALMPEQAIVVDEAISSGRGYDKMMATTVPHDWLPNTGGSIGQGLPNAVGAAVACPDRKVIALSGDGSAMYTVQSLWTMARENLDITIVIYANRGYQILRQNMRGVGINEVGESAARLIDVNQPELDWQMMAQAHGVEAGRAADLDTFIDLLKHGLETPGPFLIEAVV